MIAALQQTWPPFVLVAGLLLVGIVAGEDGLFEVAGGCLERVPGPPLALFGACCGVVAVTTALLNLDTAAVFLTPILLAAARRRGASQEPFLYGALFMANASSLYLPGSNLTNLLVLSERHVSGGAFLTNMLPVALSATVVTAAGLAAMHIGALRRDVRRPEAPAGWAAGPPTHRGGGIGVGLLGVAAAVGLMVALRDAALPVLGVGVAAVGVRVLQRRITMKQAATRLGAPALVALFVVAAALGTLARATGFPGDAIGSAGTVATASIAGLASIVVNNLPAAALLSAGHTPHLRALLVGLNVGPNLALSGSLSALLWWRAARAAGARPSVWAFSRQGVALAPLAVAAALAVSATVGGL